MGLFSSVTLNMYYMFSCVGTELLIDIMSINHSPYPLYDPKPEFWVLKSLIYGIVEFSDIEYVLHVFLRRNGTINQHNVH